ncbi:hypothetical protein Tco_1491709 [Tanacetum coccineum]
MTSRYGRYLKLEDVLVTLNSRELQKMTEAKGDGGDRLYSEELLKRDCPSVEELLDWIMDSGGSYHITYRRDYLVDFEKYDSGNILLGDGRECRVWGQAKLDITGYSLKRGFYREDVVGQDQVTRKTLKGRKQLGEYQTGWKIKTLIHQQNGLVKETNMTLLAKVLQGVDFEVEPQEDHAFEVEPLRNVDQGAEDSNEAASEVAKAKKIYAHESLTFNNTVAYEAEIWAPKGGGPAVVNGGSPPLPSLTTAVDRCWPPLTAAVDRWTGGGAGDIDGTVPTPRGTTQVVTRGYLMINCRSRWRLRGTVHQRGQYEVQNSEGQYEVQNSEGLVRGDCDVEKNGKWSCIYTVGSQEYQMVCMRLDIASEDILTMPWEDRSLSWVDQSQVEYMTLTEAVKEVIWLKGFSTESEFEPRLVVGIATGALTMAIPGSKF